MLRKFFLSLFVALSPLNPSLVSAGQLGHYLLSDIYIGGGFLLGFEHEAIEDPTGGHVKYVDEKTAFANNLTLDVRHVPEGCAIAGFLGDREANWPEDGEVDIIEGINDLEPNKVIFHTTHKSWEETDVPEDVAKGLLMVNPDEYGIPSAYFPNVSCGLEEHFGAHNIIINLTLCGSWAGAQNVYGDQAGCPCTCIDYVNNHPEAFKSAYWEFATVRVYE